MKDHWMRSHGYPAPAVDELVDDEEKENEEIGPVLEDDEEELTVLLLLLLPLFDKNISQTPLVPPGAIILVPNIPNP